MADADLKFRITADSRPARDEIARFNANLRRELATMRSALRSADSALGEAGTQGNRFASSLGRISPAAVLSAVGIGSMAAAALGAGKATLDYSMKLEQLRISFTTLLGSSQAATKHLKELETFASRTPFEFEDVARASQRFQNMGLSASEVIPLLTAVGNAVAAAGGGSEQIDRVTLALSQMTAKGKVSAEEMNQLAEAGIGGWRILEEQLGKSKSELMKMAEQGKISSAVFIEAFKKFSDAKFGDAMSKQARTMGGALSTLKDNLKTTAAEGLDPFYRLLRNITVTLADATTKTKTWGQVARQAAGAGTELMLGVISASGSQLPTVGGQRTGMGDVRMAEGAETQAGRDKQNEDLKRFTDEWVASYSRMAKATKPAAEALADIQARLRTFGDDSAVTAAKETFRAIREDLERSASATPEILQEVAALEARAMAEAKVLDARRAMVEAQKKMEAETKQAQEERERRVRKEMEIFREGVAAFREFADEQKRNLTSIAPMGYKSNFDKAVDSINAFGEAIDKANVKLTRQNELVLSAEAMWTRMRGLMLDVKENMENFEFIPLENMGAGDGSATGGPVLAPGPPEDAPERWESWGAMVRRVMGEVSAEAGNLKTMVGGAMFDMAGALESSIQGWLLYGGSIGKAIKQATAQVLAGLAAQAAVKAIWELAEGFAALARAFFGDPKAGAEAAFHFKAAAIYGGVAAIAGIGARGLSGGGAGNNSASGSAFSSGGTTAGASRGSSDTQVIEASRNRGVQVIEHRHVFEVQSNDSHIVRVVETDVSNNGSLRGLIVQTAES